MRKDQIVSLLYALCACFQKSSCWSLTRCCMLSWREYEMTIFHFKRVIAYKTKIWISQVVFSPWCTCPGPTRACSITVAPAAHEVTLQACLQCEMLLGWNHPKHGLVYWEMGNTTWGEWRSCLASLVIHNMWVSRVSPEVWKAWELSELFAFPFWLLILAILSKLITRAKKKKVGHGAGAAQSGLYAVWFLKCYEKVPYCLCFYRRWKGARML